MTSLCIVEGKIHGKGRPRFAYLNGKTFVYTDKATKDYEKQIKKAYVKQCKGEFHEAYVIVTIVAYFEPNKTEQKRGDRMPQRKPDADNIAKIVLDALNGLAFPDDKTVNCVRVQKEFVFDDEPEHLEICIDSFHI